jgi:DNA polymerase-1
VFADCEGDNFVPDLTKIWLIQLAVGVEGEIIPFADQPGYRPIREALAILKAAPAVVFHNGMGYDIYALNKLYPGTLHWTQMIDTLVLSRLKDTTAMRHSLKDIGEALGIEKGDFHDFSQFSTEMVTYGIQDVRILQAAWAGKGRIPGLGPFYRRYHKAADLEFQVSYLMQAQTLHGFRFDYEAAQILEADFGQEQMNLSRELQDIFPPITFERFSEKTGKRLKDGIDTFNPGSRQQIEERLVAKYGWKPLEWTSPKKDRAKIDETILSSLEYPEAKTMARYMFLEKKIGMLSEGTNAWLRVAQAKVNGDYFIHGSVNPLGARTHRMSHFKPNVAQADKDPRMRKLWLADRGKVLVGVDAEGLELRMLAHFLAIYDGGAYGDTVHKGDKKLGTDVHTVNMKAAGLLLRDSAKTAIYATLYGAFDKKLGTVKVDDLKASGMPVPKTSLTKLGEEVRAGLEGGIKGFGALTEKCKALHNKSGKMPGVDGRWIPSGSDHSALNTLLQGNGSIVMKKSLTNFEDEMSRLQLNDQFEYCVNCHDEWQTTCDEGIADVVLKTGMEAITKAGVDLGIRCVLVGAGSVGLNWADTH